MPQLFPQWSNTVARIGFVAVLLSPVLIPGVLMIAVRTPYRTSTGIVRQQPVPFSHRHHVGEMRIDCRYCHETAEVSSFAGMPGTHVCMTCHSQLWTHAKPLAPVRASLANNQPLRWQRLHRLPDYVYFDHSIHLSKGVACEQCHGRVDTMPLTFKKNALSMQFCLDCHRNPAPRLRPRESVTAMGWEAGDVDREQLGQRLLQDYHIRTGQLTDCSMCHR